MTAAAVLAACSSGTEPATTPTQEIQITAEEALARALQTMRAIPGFRFEMTHPTGSTELSGGLQLRKASGAAVNPGRLELEAEADLGRAFVRVQAIVIDGETWMTNFLTGNWSKIPPEDSPFSFLDPIQLVVNVLDQVTAPARLPSESEGTLLLTGKAPAIAFRSLVGRVDEAAQIDVRLTLDSTSFALLEAEIIGHLQPNDGADAVWLIELSGFDSNILIEPPI